MNEKNIRNFFFSAEIFYYDKCLVRCDGIFKSSDFSNYSKELDNLKEFIKKMYKGNHEITYISILSFNELK